MNILTPAALEAMAAKIFHSYLLTLNDCRRASRAAFDAAIAKLIKEGKAKEYRPGDSLRTSLGMDVLPEYSTVFPCLIISTGEHEHTHTHGIQGRMKMAFTETEFQNHDHRIEALERQMRELREELARLRDETHGGRP